MNVRRKLVAAFAVSSALAVFAALAFVNNVVALVRWWRAFLAAGGDSTHVAAHAPGVFPWLDWSAVDYSSVTTLIPLVGFTAMALGAWRLLKGRRVAAETFPFFRGSDQLHIALGLFGTLWGIIVIGYFKLDTVTMADLMQCLHTALFSTLMAVVWVFLVDRPLVRPLFAKLLAEAGLAEVEEGDLEGAVDRLVARLDAASESFDKRIAAYEFASETRQQAYEEAFAKRQREFEAAAAERAAAASETFEKRERAQAEAFAKREAEHEAAFEKRLADYQAEFDARQREYVEVFKRRIAELESKAEAAERRADAADARVADIARIARSWN